ncbi:MAG: hypothetical protein AB7V13_20810 [Pseudorhodoplanes sp.]|uniref:hypothetical protein n=1 Tax=Pseudorhodoplanes sp. TaxID=1934341 RepID=UPI003D0DFF2B
MLPPCLAHLSHRAGVGRTVEQSLKIERVPLCEKSPHQRVIPAQTPIRYKLESRPSTLRRKLHLGIASALEERLSLRIGEAGVGQVRVTELIGPHVPLALEVIADKRSTRVVLRRSGGIILDQHVVKCLGAGLVGDTHNAARRIEKQRSVQPEHASLEVVSLLSRNDGLRHEQPFQLTGK